MIARFQRYLDPLPVIKQKKILSELDPLWQNILDPRMNYFQKYHTFTSEVLKNNRGYGHGLLI